MLSRLPPLPAALPARLRPLLSRLPMRPPSQALALALNRLLLPRLPADVRGLLSGPVVKIDVLDLGLSLDLVLEAHGFRGVPAGAPPALRIAADLASYWRLLRGRDDADRLFFERALVMEGDTELGLVLKNTLDAIGPLWQ